MPFGQSADAVLLEDITAIEVAVEIKVIIDRGVSGNELLQGFDIPEFRHRAFSSSKWLVRVFRPVVEPAPTFLAIRKSDDMHRRPV